MLMNTCAQKANSSRGKIFHGVDDNRNLYAQRVEKTYSWEWYRWLVSRIKGCSYIAFDRSCACIVIKQKKCVRLSNIYMKKQGMTYFWDILKLGNTKEG